MAQNGSLEGAVVVVTGAAGGIGRAFTQTFLDTGARVLAADVRGDPQLDAEMADRGVADRVHVTNVDVTVRADTQRMAVEALGRWGRVDVLVNNAGLYAGLFRGPLEEIPDEEWQAVMNVNVAGVWNATRAVVPAMREQGYGKIINISSSAVLKGTPHSLHYVASKGAVLAMTRAMARELGQDGVRVNSITPGLVSNEASRRGRAVHEFAERAQERARERCLPREMTADDLLGTAVFLASPASDFLTGQNLNVDGGAFHY